MDFPFLHYIGARLVACADGTAHNEVDLVHHHHNSFGVAHGGVLMALPDVTMAFCEAGVVDRSGQLVARASGTLKYVRQRKIAS